MSRRQTIPPAKKFTIDNFNTKFPTNAACLEWLKEKKWPDGIAPCVKCKKDRKHHKVSGRPAWSCGVCGSMISPMAGTIFEKSSTSLRTWFYVAFLMASTRCGISAKQVQRETGVTYKTAWRMMRQIRKLMAESVKLHKGPIEMDEGFFGGSDLNKPQHLRGKAKTTVLGTVERNGRVVARVIPDKSEAAIVPVVREIVWPRTTIHTDLQPAYEGLRYMGMGLKHKTVNKSQGHKSGHVHTNSVEGFWSLVKRGIAGVYHQVGLDYLQSYLDEYTFRYNRRNIMRPMFSLLIERTASRVPLLAPATQERLSR